MQFLILDMDVESEEQEEVLEKLYKLAEGRDQSSVASSDEEDSSKPKKKGKKKAPRAACLHYLTLHFRL